jgi:hypothetical protein
MAPTQIKQNPNPTKQSLEDSDKTGRFHPSHHLMILLSARKTSFIHYDRVVGQWQHMGLSS